MFHVELRQFPHVARTFNLGAEELQARIVSPWRAGEPIELDERRWDPGRARLTIYQARELAADELGLGRGWGTVSREGEDVTEQVLNASRVEETEPVNDVKAQLLASLGDGEWLPLPDVVGLVGDAGWRVSERLALAEQTVWELLHEERLTLVDDDGPVSRDRWQATLLTWSSWSPDSGVAVRPPGP